MLIGTYILIYVFNDIEFLIYKILIEKCNNNLAEYFSYFFNILN